MKKVKSFMWNLLIFNINIPIVFYCMCLKGVVFSIFDYLVAVYIWFLFAMVHTDSELVNKEIREIKKELEILKSAQNN